MKNSKIIILFFFCMLTSCSFQPNNADGIILLKHSKNVLNLSIIDSYNVISKYKAYKIEDTLFVNVLSISKPQNSTLERPILISFDRNIHFVKLQNDKIYNVDSIPYHR